MRTSTSLSMLLLAATAFAACGEERAQGRADGPTSSTLYVQVRGMVQELGIT